MIRSWRIYFGLALVVVMALTSQSMAVARGAAGVAGQIEICIGSGPVTVYVDDSGNPTGPPHICPDFALHFLAFVTPPAILPAPLTLEVRRLSACQRGLCSGRPVPTARARDPPSVG
ncbi:hypothetical protein [Pseudodonghicola xiamenensis]|uniref:DUF2946 domain-containing protein n=1 Tax=Pseudodonghicola xiamenensis TaxID=337702 RepID=A0A8J3ME98_9RHOB|nr:hypothetical protein [Pseudodonghicola xiamenensis]GHH01725.1 hypothetical protein GCM10010961_39210 [Pseudodonghicola xiamenensis]